MELTMIRVSSKTDTFSFLKNLQNFITFLRYSRTPGSRQPSPAEEHLARNSFGLEQGINVNVGGFQPMMQHMLNNHEQQQQQMGSSSFHPQQHPLGPHVGVMNGGMPVQVRT